MENYITCPSCNEMISDNPLIDVAAKKEGSSSRAITCKCGEQIIFWAYQGSGQSQKGIGWRFKDWLNLF